MAKKKFLNENGKQIWPITRADCIYTEDGKKLLSEDYASKKYVDDAVAENGFSGDYNDLENRPCYEDGNGPTLTTFVTDPGTKEIITVNGGMSYGFEPDLPLPADIGNPISLTFTVKKSGTTVTEVNDVTPSLNSPGIYTVLSSSGYPLAFIILEDGLNIGNVSVKKGIYVASQAYGNEYVKSITYTVNNSILKQLDEKFIPDTIATKQYVNDEITKLRDEMIVLEEDDLSIDGLIDHTFPELTTTDKTLTGAINEINNKMQNNQPGEGQVEEIEKSVVDEMLMDVFGVVIDEEVN